MATTTEKLHALIHSVDSLKRAQDRNQEEMLQKLTQLKIDMVEGQEMTQHLIKRLKCEQRPDFRRKGHEGQFNFVKKIKDRVDTAMGLLAKVRPENEQQVATIMAAMDELGEGRKEMEARQKLIRIADCSDLGWQLVDAYESDELMLGNEDVKHIKKAKKVAEQRAEK